MVCQLNSHSLTLLSADSHSLHKKRLHCILLNNSYRTCNIHIHIHQSYASTYLFMDNNHIENAKYSITISRIHLSCLWDQLQFPQPASQDLEVEHGQDQNNTSSVSVSAHGASETRSLHSKICCNGDKTCQVSYTPGSALIHPLILSLAMLD